jgi:hypothetical protein
MLCLASVSCAYKQFLSFKQLGEKQEAFFVPPSGSAFVYRVLDDLGGSKRPNWQPDLVSSPHASLADLCAVQC